jgi:ligand-binding sensor protein
MEISNNKPLRSNENNIENLQNIRFDEIFDINEIQRLQDIFADAHGLASIITDTEGNPITQASNFSDLCQNIIRKTEKGCANCFKSDAIIGRNNPDGAVVQPCLSGGLWDAGASITVGGKHIASWLIGQVRNNELNVKEMLHYAEEIGADTVAFKAALEKVPEMSVKQFRKIADLLFVIANELSEKAYKNILLKQKNTILEVSEEKFRTIFENSQVGKSITTIAE